MARLPRRSTLPAAALLAAAGVGLLGHAALSQEQAPITRGGTAATTAGPSVAAVQLPDSAEPSASPPVDTATATSTPGTSPMSTPTVPLSLPVSTPTDVRIPSLGVESTLAPLGLLPDGSLEVPTDFQQAGWYTGGVTPGEVGTAVIAGHVDSSRGPAVFFRLAALRAGDRVQVSRSDGSTAAFVVYRSEQFAKDQFPTTAVYGATGGAELRLITCGGDFDPGTKHYRDNIVVFARLQAN